MKLDFWNKAGKEKTPKPADTADVGKISVIIELDTSKTVEKTFCGEYSSIFYGHIIEAKIYATQFIRGKDPVRLPDGLHFPRHRIKSYKLTERVSFMGEKDKSNPTETAWYFG